MAKRVVVGGERGGERVLMLVGRNFAQQHFSHQPQEATSPRSEDRTSHLPTDHGTHSDIQSQALVIKFLFLSLLDTLCEGLHHATTGCWG